MLDFDVVSVEGRHFHLKSGRQSPPIRFLKRSTDLLGRLRPTLGPNLSVIARAPARREHYRRRSRALPRIAARSSVTISRRRFANRSSEKRLACLFDSRTIPSLTADVCYRFSDARGRRGVEEHSRFPVDNRVENPPDRSAAVGLPNAAASHGGEPEVLIRRRDQSKGVGVEPAQLRVVD